MLRPSRKPLATAGSRLHFLSLPTEIRLEIYSHLFPSMRQIYLMASRKLLHLMMRPGSLALDILLTCRQLNGEANDYFFNNYLFNIIGYKKYCMAHYKPIYHLVEKYAKQGSNIEFLDNGTISSTACVSIYAKGGHVEAMLHIRQRGVPRDLKEVEDEAAQLPDILDEIPVHVFGPWGQKVIVFMGFVIEVLERVVTPTTTAAALVIGVAIWIAWLIR